MFRFAILYKNFRLVSRLPTAERGIRHPPLLLLACGRAVAWKVGSKWGAWLALYDGATGLLAGNSVESE